MSANLLIYRCAAVADATGVEARPGAVAVRDGRIVAAGAVAEVESQFPEAPAAAGIDLSGSLLMPAMVNVHAHLDLTMIGPRPYGGDFIEWVKMVKQQRAGVAGQIARSVWQGVSLSRLGGVGWIGDIAGSVEAAAALAMCRVPAVSYLECFGHGDPQPSLAAVGAAMASLPQQRQSDRPWRLGIQPHAPYSASRVLYESAVELAEAHDLLLATHLAETREELQFVGEAAGPLAQYVRELGKWDDSIQPRHMHPVQWLGEPLRQRPWLLAHCNYVDDQQIQALAQAGASVAYCPIASDYFGHRGHRYREMLDAGVNVALGTDSMLCQPAKDPQPLSILSQMRHLYRRDGTDPRTLLAMATVNGLRALGFDPMLASLRPGAAARLMAVNFDADDPTDALTQVLSSRYPVSIIAAAEQPSQGRQS